MGSIVRSTLGPYGLDTMVVRQMDDNSIRTFVSNDGIAIIEEFEGETSHPIARRFIGLAEDHEATFGDGTTATVLLASAFLEEALSLVDDGLHPTTVVEGLSIGGQRTLEVWNDRSRSITTGQGELGGSLDRQALATVARTAMTNGRNESWPLEYVADDLVEAVLRVSNRETGHVDIGRIDTRTVPGGNVTDSEIIDAKYLLKEPVTAERLLPLSGGVLLVEGSLSPRAFSMNATISSPDEDVVQELRRRNGGEMDRLARHVASAGVELVVAGEEISHEMARALARQGVACVQNVTRSDREFVSSIIDAPPISTVSPSMAIPRENVGTADVRTVAIGDRDWMRLRADSDVSPDVGTIVVRGGTERTADEAKRRLTGGMNAVRAAIKQPTVLPAGGAPDSGAAESVRSLAPSIDGREQLAVEAYADALEVIPRTLARNAGLDSLDTLTTLRRYHAAGHTEAGIAADGSVVESVGDRGGYDASLVRTTGLVRALEFANALVRIDQLLVDERPPRGLER